MGYACSIKLKTVQDLSPSYQAEGHSLAHTLATFSYSSFKSLSMTTPPSAWPQLSPGLQQAPHWHKNTEIYSA